MTSGENAAEFFDPCSHSCWQNNESTAEPLHDGGGNYGIDRTDTNSMNRCRELEYQTSHSPILVKPAAEHCGSAETIIT